MPQYVQTLNTILSLGTILLQALFIAILFVFIFKKSKDSSILKFLARHTFLLVFLLGLSGLLMSLLYSEIIGFPACELCWWQRLFIYPQVLLFGFLLFRPLSNFKKLISSIGVFLATVGSLISIFHIYIEHGGSSSLACAGDSTTAVTCTARYVYEFGYITIPVMALTVSLSIFLLLMIYKYYQNVSIKSYDNKEDFIG